jgi:hypothetical protein
MSIQKMIRIYLNTIASFRQAWESGATHNTAARPLSPLSATR